jgi:hypothetical protein
MDLLAIQSAITSLKAATDISKAILEMKTMTEVQGKVIELQSALLDVQQCAINATTSQFELHERIKELELELKNKADWQKVRERYSLTNPWRGPAQVYALKAASSDGEPAHFLCTNCFHNHKQVILNPAPTPAAGTHNIKMNCPECKSSIDTGYRGIGEPKYAEEYKKA